MTPAAPARGCLVGLALSLLAWLILAALVAALLF